jgi:hypothetical protein
VLILNFEQIETFPDKITRKSNELSTLKDMTRDSSMNEETKDLTDFRKSGLPSSKSVKYFPVKAAKPSIIQSKIPIKSEFTKTLNTQQNKKMKKVPSRSLLKRKKS